MTTSTRVTLAKTPYGSVSAENFGHDTVEPPPLEDGEFLVAVAYLSIDPTIRGWMAYDTYLPKIAEGEVIRSLGAGEVIESRNPKYPVGTRVTGLTGWQSHVVMDGGYRIPEGVDYPDALSVFGMTGLTAWVGLADIGKPKPRETLLVSGAAGAVGSVAGQIGKIRGCRVVGIAGGAEKCQWVVDELGFDACIDYRSEKVPRRLRETCPDGIDVYFDNVGGEILDAALGQINNYARIVLCGMISRYDRAEKMPGPANLVNAVPRRALLQGFIVLDHMHRAKEAFAEMAPWVADGRLKSRVDVTEGLQNAPVALERLFTGANIGKTLVRV